MYGLYIRLPGAYNFYNIYPNGIYEIDDQYKKIRKLFYPNNRPEIKTVNYKEFIDTTLSYFNKLNPNKDGIYFYSKKDNRGIFKFTNIKNIKNVLVSIEYNKSDIILDKDLYILNTNNEDTIDLKKYAKQTYDIDLKDSTYKNSDSLSIFDENRIYILNPEDNTVLSIENILNKQIIKRIDTQNNLLEIDLMGGDELEVKTFTPRDIKPN